MFHTVRGAYVLFRCSFISFLFSLICCFCCFLSNFPSCRSPFLSTFWAFHVWILSYFSHDMDWVCVGWHASSPSLSVKTLVTVCVRVSQVLHSPLSYLHSKRNNCNNINCCQNVFKLSLSLIGFHVGGSVAYCELKGKSVWDIEVKCQNWWLKTRGNSIPQTFTNTITKI